MSRFILLEHTGAADDPSGRHFDLLLEDGGACRTWRLSGIPAAGSAAVEATPIAPHRLAWLDHINGPVSGNRGHARRIDAGTFTWCESTTTSGQERVRVHLAGGRCRGKLTIASGRARLSG